jgi:uncharacterized protein YoxC
VYNVSNGRQFAADPITVEEPYEYADRRESFNFVPRAEGQYEIECVATVGPKEPALQATTPLREITTQMMIVATADASTQETETKEPCSLQIISPGQPCAGSVHEYHTDGSIEVRYLVTGTFQALTISVHENPCGTWVPPTTTDGGGHTQEKPPTITTDATGQYREVSRTYLPTATGTNLVTMTIDGFIAPGSAYVLHLEGVCPNDDGSTSLVSAEDHCFRYRPLTTSTTTSDGSGASGSTETHPTTRERTPETPKVPVEETPCPNNLICVKDVDKNAGPKLDATLELKNPELYPYPRAVPLRVNAIDWDYAIFKCIGCGGGEASKWIPVRDDIASWKWELKGKGSLKDPFPLGKITELDEKIKELIEKLKLVSDSISATEKDKKKALDEFKGLQDAARPQLDSAKSKLKSVTESLDEVKKSMDSLRKHMESLAMKMDSIAGRFTELRDSVRMHQDSVNRYDSLLTNPPSKDELAKLTAVESAEKALADARSDLQALEEKLKTTTADLQAAIKAADAALRDAVTKYSNAQNTVGKQTKKVAELQAALYASAALKDYQRSRRDMQRNTASFIAAYPGASGLTTLSDRVVLVLDAVHTALEGTSVGERAAAKKKLDSISDDPAGRDYSETLGSFGLRYSF